MNKKVKKKNPLKLKACVVALSLWGLSAPFALSSSPVMAAETASNAAQEQVAKALFNKGGDLYELHRYEESIAAYNDLITRFGNSQDKIIQEQVANALFNKGSDLYELHRYEEDIAEYIDLITTPNPQYKKISQYTKIKEFELGSLHRYLLEEALATYNDLITRFGNSQDKIIQEAVANALLNKGVVLERLNFSEEAVIAGYNDLITRFSNSQDTKIQEVEEAIAAYNDLITRFSNSQDKIIQEAVANALFNKGADLQSSLLHRPEEAIAAYNDLITRFSNSQDKIIQELVAYALDNKGVTRGFIAVAYIATRKLLPHTMTSSLASVTHKTK